MRYDCTIRSDTCTACFRSVFRCRCGINPPNRISAMGSSRLHCCWHSPLHLSTCFIFLQGSPVPPQGVANGYSPAPAAAGAAKKKKRKKKGCCAWVCPCCCPSRRTKAAQVEPGDSSDEDAEAAADAKAFVNQIKNITGLWDNDPDEVRPDVANGARGERAVLGACRATRWFRAVLCVCSSSGVVGRSRDCSCARRGWRRPSPNNGEVSTICIIV